jgi:hypothetical protein
MCITKRVQWLQNKEIIRHYFTSSDPGGRRSAFHGSEKASMSRPIELA